MIAYYISGLIAVGWFMACTWVVSLFIRNEDEWREETDTFLVGFALYTVSAVFIVTFLCVGVSWHTLGVILGSLAFGVGMIGAMCLIGMFREWWPSKADRAWAKLSTEEKWARYAQLDEAA